ncbi:MAG: hypothetical protein ABEK59_01945 [Halobacteria archaeon]
MFYVLMFVFCLAALLRMKQTGKFDDLLDMREERTSGSSGT